MDFWEYQLRADVLNSLNTLKNFINSSFSFDYFLISPVNELTNRYKNKAKKSSWVTPNKKFLHFILLYCNEWTSQCWEQQDGAGELTGLLWWLELNQSCSADCLTHSVGLQNEVCSNFQSLVVLHKNLRTLSFGDHVTFCLLDANNWAVKTSGFLVTWCLLSKGAFVENDPCIWRGRQGLTFMLGAGEGKAKKSRENKKCLSLVLPYCTIPLVWRWWENDACLLHSL